MKEGLTIRIEYSRNVICLVKMSRSVCTIWKLWQLEWESLKAWPGIKYNNSPLFLWSSSSRFSSTTRRSSNIWKYSLPHVLYTTRNDDTERFSCLKTYHREASKQEILWRKSPQFTKYRIASESESTSPDQNLFTKEYLCPIIPHDGEMERTPKVPILPSSPI